MRLARLLMIVGASLVLSSCFGGREERFERFLQLGNEYHDKGQYAEASIMYRKALQQDRRSAEAWYRLALNSLSERQYQDAARALFRAFELDPDNLDAFRKLAELHLMDLANPLLATEQVLDNLIALSEKAEARHPDAFEVLYIKGRILRHQGQNESALDLLRRAQETNSEDYSLSVVLSRVLMDLDRYEEAEKLIGTLLADDQPAPEAFDLMYLAMVRQRRYDKALEVLEHKCEEYPGITRNWLFLAHFHRGMKNEVEMKNALQHLLDDDEVFPNGRYSVGDFYLQGGQPDVALEHFRKGLELGGDSTVLYRQGIVRAYLAKGEAGVAARELDAILDESPENPSALAMRGLLALQSGNADRLASATSDLERAVSLRPESYLFRYYLAEAHRASGDTLAAKTQLRESIKLSGGFIPAKYSLIELHLTNQEYTDAELLAREILDERPMDATARLRLCEALIGLEDYERAREQIGQLREQSQSPSQVAYLLGRIELACGNQAAAAREFRESLRADPENELAAQALFSLQMDRRQFDDAEKLVRSWSGTQAVPADLQVLLARIALARGSADIAAAILRKVLEENPDHAAAHLDLGNLLLLSGRQAEAVPHFRRVIDSGAKDARAYFGYGTILFDEGKLTEAQEMLRQAISLAPDYAEALNNLAWTLAESSGDLDLALTYAQRAVAQQPDNADFADTLAYVYLKRNLSDDALKILDKLVKQHPNRSTFRYHLGLAHYQKGNFDEARRELEAARGGQLPPDTRQAVAQLLTEIGG